MLKFAQLYKEQLSQLDYSTWGSLNYQYCNDCYNSLMKLDDDTWNHLQFVSVDKKDKVIGFIQFNINRGSNTIYGVDIFSNRTGNPQFAVDLYQAIYDCFYKYKFHKIEFIAYEDNPTIHNYVHFINKVGGNICGYKRQSAKLLDGKYHNVIEFEIMKDEFKPIKNRRFKN